MKKKLKLNTKKKKGNNLTKIVVLLIIGMLGSGLMQSTAFHTKNQMQRITNRLEDEFGILNVTDVECNEHNCWQLEGKWFELKDGKELWIYRFNNEIFADHVIEAYENEVVFPDYKYIKYTDEKLNTYILKSNHTMTDDEFDAFIAKILKEL